MLISIVGCSSAPSRHETKSSSRAANADDLPSLADAMDKLQSAMEKPSSPFHLSLKKVQSDGYSYQCEADVSSDGITGQQTDVSPTTHIGNEVFPASTKVRNLNGSPVGSSSWGIARTGILMAYMNGRIGDAQPGVKYVGEEQTGGYAARRYDFDLTGIEADAKKAMMIGNSFGGGRQVKDYNVKGSAWVAKDDGRMVKFQFDSFMLFSDGENYTTHYDGVVTKK